MLTEAGYDPEDCRALTDVIARVGDRWTMLVIGALGAAPTRFNELRRAIVGISPRMLTHTLRGLERDGMITRTPFLTNPPTVEYALTERGKELLEPIYALAKWGRFHRDGIVQSRQRYDDQTRLAENASETGIYRLSMRLR